MMDFLGAHMIWYPTLFIEEKAYKIYYHKIYNPWKLGRDNCERDTNSSFI